MRIFSLITVVTCLTSTALAQKPKPRFVLNPGGPVNQVLTLAFSPDSTRIYSAGRDKVVHAWALEERGRIVRRASAKLVQTLRWELARSLRGVIYTMAASPVDRRLAVAGYSARQATGDIIIFDTGTGQVETSLPAGPVNEKRVGHRQTIVSLAFAPDGKRLASMSVDGELRVWDVPAWTFRQIRPPQTRHTDRQMVCFLNNNVLATTVPADAARRNWKVALYDLSQPNRPPLELPQLHLTKIMALAADPKSQRWASADRQGAIYIWDGTGNQQPALLRQGLVAEGLAFGPQSTLLVATRLDDELAEKNSARLEMWDTTRRQKIDQFDTARTDSNFACSVSPDGRWAVTCGGDKQALFVFRLLDARGNLLRKPLSSGRPLLLQGFGRKVGKVAFDARPGSYRIGFGPPDKVEFNNYGPVSHAFELQNPKLLDKAPQGAQWRDPEAQSGGWKAVVSDSWDRLELHFGGRKFSQITLDPAMQGKVRSFCWLPGIAADGRTSAYAIAVGTDQQCGVFIYQVVTRGECPLIRYFRHHSGWVTSLSVSSDGRFLASGSVDSSIKVWSLDGIETWPKMLAANLAFPQAAAWGSQFSVRGNSLAAELVQPVGIAFARDLRSGDVVKSIRFVQGNRVVTETQPRRMLQALSRHKIWETMELNVTRAGAAQEPIRLLPAWEPVVTLFATRNNEWALVTPQGPYDASVEGDAFFGWLINRGVNNTPNFVKGEQLRKQLEQPKTIRDLFVARKVPQQADLRKLTAAVPQIQILQPTDGRGFARGQPIKLVAQVDFATKQAAGQFEIKSYVNGAHAAEPKITVAADGLRHTATWDIQDPIEFNRAVVVADDRFGQGGNFDLKQVHFRAQPGPVKPKLHILAIAAAQAYPAGMKLDYPVADAQDIVKTLRQNAGPLYDLDPKNVHIVVEDKVSKAAVLQRIADMRGVLKNARPSDLLVVFIAGHGISIDDEFHFVCPDERLKDANAANADTLKVVKETGVAWNAFLTLDTLPCRKMFLMDACRSGAALNLVAGGVVVKNDESTWEDAIRPLSHRQIFVVSATSPGEDAYEHESWGHGAFTKCLLDGFGGQADGFGDGVRIAGDSAKGPPDGDVSYDEISHFVQLEVPKLVSDFQGFRQTPRAYPSQVGAATFYLPLVVHGQGRGKLPVKKAAPAGGAAP